MTLLITVGKRHVCNVLFINVLCNAILSNVTHVKCQNVVIISKVVIVNVIINIGILSSQILNLPEKAGQ
jgi:hypothetical protein